MIIDIIALLLLLWALFKGLSRGFVVAVFSFIAFLIGLAAALKLSSLVAGYLGSNTSISQRWLPFLAFAAVFIVVALLVKLGAKAIEAMLRMAMMGWLNRIGGVLLYVLLYFFIFSLVLFYAEELKVIKPETTSGSVVYPLLHPLGPKVVNALGILLPFFKNMFSELEKFFSASS
jgi:membrane protein required for colicin V production